MINIRFALLASAAALAISNIAAAQPSDGAAPFAGGATSTTSAELVEGEVRKVDKDSKKLTLKHGPLKNLDMPAMTMVFQVKEEAMLDNVQAGEKVRFQAEKIDGKFTVTRLEAAR
ncbi:Cation efflux system protein CusF precursor [Variovorax sp. PBL-H6]|uniref:copper-binding protein n=1 Tax=Variovorax sp. PBL-H6 TaxID=434009 RepID=UPI001317A92B|nr:copper-binding protein [Variovorax sp. PBL-H6]VTU21181.1 Cation efflux system protein CusF precursor [Variovorax sp. PBL-H6]